MFDGMEPEGSRMDPAVVEVATRGYDLLDRDRPGWDREADEPFELSNCKECPMALAYGSYQDGLGYYGWSNEDARPYGFTLMVPLSSWEPLNIVWNWLRVSRRHARYPVPSSA
jgi:hypothetical protein